MRQIISATQIDQWFISTSRDAQEILPHLVRKLIFETVELAMLKVIRIPVVDQIRLPDYDGRVETAVEHPYIPIGLSVWEMGTGDPKTKANKVYNDRTQNPKGIDPLTTTFVFVTPHPWGDLVDNKSNWANEKKKKKWKDVRVLDGVDLESWLELAPSAARWLAREMGVPIEGMRDLESFIREEFDARYGIQISPQVLIGGRDDSMTELHRWIDSDSREIRVEGESTEEATAFITAAINCLQNEKKESVISRLLFVDKPEALDYLSSLPSTHFIIPLTSEVRRRAKAIGSSTFRLIVPCMRASSNVSQGKSSFIKLGTVRRSSCEQALAGMGLPSQKAHRIAQESKGSLTAILWMIAEEQDKSLPWATGEAALDLVPLVLIGEWAADSAADRAIVERIADRKYSEIERIITRWTSPVGPIVRRGPTWDWLAWDYAWVCLAPYIDSKQIDRFREIVKEILGTPDPSLELTPDNRWAANVYGKVHPYSAALRAGLIGSIAQFSIHGQSIRGQDGRSIANVLVYDLLDEPTLSREQAWLSLAPWVPDLAEAAPEEFLKAFDKLLLDKDAINAFFEEGGLYGSNPHTYLLWALERLAWSDTFLTPVILALGKLAATDPGGNVSNRPANSLKYILLPWHPQTTADITHRLDAIDVLYQQQPEVAWNLGVSLFPRGMGFSISTAVPRWQSWNPDEDAEMSDQDYWLFIENLVSRMLEWVGTSGSRWSQLIESYDGFRRQYPELAKQLLLAMQKLNPADLTEADHVALSNTLRGLLSHHREVSDAEWSMSEEDLRPFEELYERFQPSSLMEQYKWLFSSWPELPRNRNLSYDLHLEHIREEREDAVRAIYGTQGFGSLLSFAETVERPHEIGFALAQIDLDEHIEADVLMRTLGVVLTGKSFPSDLQVGLGYVSGRFRKHGESWIEKVITLKGVHWDANRYANLALGLPDESTTWNRLMKWDEEAANLYWLRVPIHYLQNPERDGEQAIRKLLQASRYYRAIDLADMCIRRIKQGDSKIELLPAPAELILDLLQEAPRHDPNQEWPSPDINMIALHIECLLNILEREGIEASVIVGLEWAWMPVLKRSKRGLKALQHALSTQPQLFVEALKLVFRAEDEEEGSELSELERARATQAYRLLEEWRKVPGILDEQPAEKASEGDITFNKGYVNQEELFMWVNEARKLAKECGRLSVCDIRIGNMLAYSPKDPDGKWPCDPVRNLIEELESEELERGLKMGVYSKRGVYWRGKGGDQERKLAAKFKGYAGQVRSKYHRTAAILDQIALQYEHEARRHDEEDMINEFR